MSFTIDEGEMFGLVGESGSGKSTTGRCILRLVEPDGRRSAVSRRERARVLAQPACGWRGATCRSSFRIRTRRSIRGCASATSSRSRSIIHELGRRRRAARARRELFELVGLEPAHLARYPHEFSGGQRQRIGIARALALNPRSSSPTKPVSALDVSIQAQVIELLLDLQARLQADVSLHRPRSAAGREHLQPRGGDVSRQDRRDGRDAARCSANPTHPVHAGAAQRDSACSIPTRRVSGSSSTPSSFESGRAAARDRRH